MMAGTFGIKPPKHINLPKEAMPFWDSIVKARAAGRWNDTDLETAAELARTKYNIERLSAEIEVEGDVVKNDRGTQIVNPKHNLLETMTRRLVSLSRILQVHAEATQGKSAKQVASNKAQSAAMEAVEAVADDDLIARPMH